MSISPSFARRGALAAILVALATLPASARNNGGNSNHGNDNPGTPQGPKDVPEFDGSAVGIGLAVGAGALIAFRKQRKGK